jgi:hypothetical protein
MRATYAAYLILRKILIQEIIIENVFSCHEYFQAVSSSSLKLLKRVVISECPGSPLGYNAGCDKGCKKLE